jgi:hypothetical protein
MEEVPTENDARDVKKCLSYYNELTLRFDAVNESQKTKGRQKELEV